MIYFHTFLSMLIIYPLVSSFILVHPSLNIKSFIYLQPIKKHLPHVVNYLIAHITLVFGVPLPGSEENKPITLDSAVSL